MKNQCGSICHDDVNSNLWDYYQNFLALFETYLGKRFKTPSQLATEDVLMCVELYRNGSGIAQEFFLLAIHVFAEWDPPFRSSLCPLATEVSAILELGNTV